jgi:hypothetical protein
MNSRYAVPAVGSLLVFVSASALLVAVTPGPLRSVDYFMCGAEATLIACLAFFIAVVRLSKLKNVFYKSRRPKMRP